MTLANLDLEVLFDARTLRGTATLSWLRRGGTLVLANRDSPSTRWRPSGRCIGVFWNRIFRWGATDKIPRHTVWQVAVDLTSLMFVSANQTTQRPPDCSGGSAANFRWKHPDLYSQSRAPSWRARGIPLQDSPAVASPTLRESARRTRWWP